MAYFQTKQSPKRAESIPPVPVRRNWRLIGPSSVIQWLIVGAVSLLLGLYILGVTTLAPQIRFFLIIAVISPFIALVVGNVRRLLLGLILLDIPFPLDVHLNYRYDLAELNAIGGIGISVTTIALIFLYALWCTESLSRMKQQSPPRVWTSVTVALAMYLAFAILSVVVAFDVQLALNEIVLLVQTFLLFIYLVATVRTRQDVLFIITMLLIGLILESQVMILLRFVGRSITLPGISGRVGDTRVGGTIGSPNSAASYFVIFLAPAMSIVLNRPVRPYRWLAALAFSLGLVGLTLTLSRGGWVGFALSMTFLFVAAWRRGKLRLSTVLMVACSVLLLSLLFRDTVTARVVGDDASPPETRIYLIKLASKIIMDNPVLGIGANNFAIAIAKYATPDFSGEWLHVVHNKYLLIWAEVGIGGLLAFLLFLMTAIRRAWRCWKVNDPLLSPLALGLMAGIIGQMAHMFFDLFHSRVQVQSLWIVTGLIVAISNIGVIKKV
jgi:O-antigen ligase